jgi:hypothetical protein
MDTYFIPNTLVRILTIVMLISGTACKSNNDKNSVKTVKFDKIVKDSIIHNVRKEVYFSSSASKDVFSLELIGESVLNGKIKFQIFTSKSEQIYSVSFNSIDMLGYEIAPEATLEQKEDFILRRMDNFFEETNFVRPAIDQSEYDSEDYDEIDEGLWNSIKNNNSVGFYYLLGEGNMTWITYLKEKNEVVKYKSCC